MASSHDPDTSASTNLPLRGLREEAELLAEAVVDTVRESLLILDHRLSIRLASRSFYMTFRVSPKETLDRLVYEIGEGQWHIPSLRQLLEEILPHNGSFQDFEVTHDFPNIGRKTMLLNARRLRRRLDQEELILLAIEDATAVQQARQALVRETHHRVKNNLQTVVSLLNLQARQAEGDLRVLEALTDASGRVQAIARLHETLYTSEILAGIHFGEYLRNLTEELRDLHGRPEIAVQVFTEDIFLDLDTAIPLGLIANELILNCLKHAFPAARSGQVTASVEYIRDGVEPGESLDNAGLRLRVQDDGIGLPREFKMDKADSLGLRLVHLLAGQLHAELQTKSGAGSTFVVLVPRRVSSVEQTGRTTETSTDFDS